METLPNPFNVEEINNPTAQIQETTIESKVVNPSFGKEITSEPIVFKVIVAIKTPVKPPTNHVDMLSLPAFFGCPFLGVPC
mmetsp:Transcript_2325/g.3524  ORF Transcript_2325/g.3524 Transcript_2325/m.3524 type:complete len:81 (-) Transcript_2325:666-908(-)